MYLQYTAIITLISNLEKAYLKSINNIQICLNFTKLSLGSLDKKDK
jgi:hypothetical protein